MPPSASSTSWQAAFLGVINARRNPRSSPGPISRQRVASEILPRLYLSDFLTALDDSELARLGITHVVSVLRTAPTFPAHIRTLHVEIDDIATEDILAHLAVTTAFIKDALAEGPNTKVLVHCLMGMSRSATVVCAYLIATTEMVADEAVAFVKERRSIVQPNPGFMRQLEQYAERFYEKGAKVMKKQVTAQVSGAPTVAQRIRMLKSGVNASAEGRQWQDYLP